MNDHYVGDLFWHLFSCEVSCAVILVYCLRRVCLALKGGAEAVWVFVGVRESFIWLPLCLFSGCRYTHVFAVSLLVVPF